MSKSIESLEQAVRNCNGLKSMEARVSKVLMQSNMSLESAISQLEDLRYDREDFVDSDEEDNVFERDIEAIDVALALMRQIQFDCLVLPNESANRIANFYGVDNQLIKAVEECGELQTAIAKYKLATHITVSEAVDNLIEEAADVYIMIMQIRIMFSAEKFDHMVIGKLLRQEERMNGEESE